jgi:hypothetical protein
MKYALSMACGLMGLWLVAGCSSTPTRVNTGAITAATYDFVTAKESDFAENRAPVHQIIQDAIADTLARKGLARAEGGGDVKVAYLVLIADNVSTTSINDYFGYGRDAAGLQDKAHEAFSMKNKNPDAFEAGTLVIDIIDARSFELLKRNYVVRPILKNIEPGARMARIRDAVNEALGDLRVKP